MEHLQTSGSSRKRPRPSPSSPKELNDHIYELYKPAEESSMDILFFHGLQLRDSTEAYKSTWMCGDGSGQIWPSTWLVDEFPNAHVFSVSYDACMMTTQEQGRFDLYSVAENLIQAICWADIGQVLGRPVILVGHSFGGLVIKSLYVKAYHTYGLGPSESEGTQDIGRFLENMRGVFFYGTPHRGSSLLDKAASFLDGPLLPYVKLLSTESARLESEFSSVCSKYGRCRIASVGESLPTPWGLFHSERIVPEDGGLVVPEPSARYGPFCTAAANHISLCQPKSKTSTSFQCLKTFLRGTIQPKVQVKARQVEAHFGNMQPTPRPLVGLDLVVKQVEDILQENEKVGLVGMGGVGKTTLAMAVFNKLGPSFQYSCFIHVMKEISGNVEELKQEIWNCLHCHGKKVDANDKEDCWSLLRGERLLLVLDDISENSNRDLDVLSYIADDIGLSESRFIVTSRNGDLLNKMDEIYRVPFLDYTNAKQLFMSRAFGPKMAVPPIALESNLEAIVKQCSGLPLTLELIGSYLRRKTNDKIWMQTLENLVKANEISNADQRLWAQLRLSYDSLQENEQQMFLDVTTFFAGNHWTLREAKGAWNVIYGSEDRRWQMLVDMSLVYDVKEDEGIWVHEQLQSLGRKIASKSKKCKIWNHVKVSKMLQSTDEPDDERVHALRSGRYIGFNIWDECTDGCTLKTVRCLDLAERPICVAGGQENETFPTDHMILLGCNTEDFGYLFSNRMLGRVVVLKLHLDPTKNYLPGFIGQLSTLKVLNMPNCTWLTSLPDEIGRLSQLECLRLLNCPNLHELPESFGELTNLKDLELTGCWGFKTLPKSFGQLRELKYLNLIDCVNFKTLPVSFGQLLNLEYLELIDCFNLETLPESFGQLRALKYLKLRGSEHMVTLPNSFGYLPALQHLEFIACSKLQILPESFEHLSTLEHLKFHSCFGMYKLPKSFGHLRALKHLEFFACHKLHILPESLGQLSALESLEFLSCYELNDLPEFFGQLAKLQHLLIGDCPEIKKLPNSLVHLKNLRCLSIRYIALRSIPDFIETLPSLQALELGFLPWLTGFPAWLGEITLASPAMSVRRIFHVQHGHFTLALAEKQDVVIAKEWILAHLVNKEVRDYDEALAALESWGSGRVTLRELFSAESKAWIRILGKNGILKRLTGDFHGALEDLDAAVKTCIDIRERTGSTLCTTHLSYICRIERGRMRYLLNDMDGAREDSEVAFKYQSSITDLFSFECIYDHPDYLNHTITSMEVLRIEMLVVHQPALSYLNFPFPFLGMVEYRANVELLTSSHSQAMEKVAGSDFAGALADFSVDIDAVDVRLLGFRVHAFILQERGILRRLTGDLNGALDDLNSALELISQRKFKFGDFRFASGYESLKQRGFVKYLLGVVDGARDDAAAAVRKFNAASNYRTEISYSTWHEGLEVFFVGSKSWDLDHEGWDVRGNKIELREGWEVAEDEVEVVEGRFFNGPEVEVVAGKVFNWSGVYKRLGEQSLKFLGFNLKY